MRNNRTLRRQALTLGVVKPPVFLQSKAVRYLRHLYFDINSVTGDLVFCMFIVVHKKREDSKEVKVNRRSVSALSRTFLAASLYIILHVFL